MEAKNIITKAVSQEGWNCNTDLCMDVKTLLLNDQMTKRDKEYPGMLTRDGEFHYTFIETDMLKSEKRNPRVFNGRYITVTRRDDGTLRPNFKPMKMDKDFNVDSYAVGVMLELCKALRSLIEKK